jgi:hypothetical protein
VFHALHHTRGVNTSNEIQDRRFSRGFFRVRRSSVGHTWRRKTEAAFYKLSPTPGPRGAALPLSELSRVLVRFDHVASLIMKADHSIM